MKIYLALATWLRDYEQGTVLTAAEGKKRLISYHLYQEEAQKGCYPTTALKTHCSTGYFESRKSKR